MGMFDIVLVPCPVCGTKAEFQSKGGNCELITYTLEEAPIQVLAEINKFGGETCSNCGSHFKVKLEVVATPIITKKPFNFS